MTFAKNIDNYLNNMPIYVCSKLNLAFQELIAKEIRWTRIFLAIIV